MSGLFIGAAVLAAVLTVACRNLLRARRERRRPGATPDNAVPVHRFDEIDAAVQGQRCPCGGKLRLQGESSREVGPRRLRLVRLGCTDCERGRTVHFDVTRVFH